MQLSTLIPAALAALTITGLTTTAAAAPNQDDGYVTQVVRSPNGKDSFVRVVKVPKATLADKRDCAKKDRAAMMAECADMMGRDHTGAAAPKG